MTSSEGNGEGIVEEPLAAAVDAVVAADETCDPETVRRTLRTVTEDGRVTRDGIDAARSDAAQILATAETRAELAAEALADAEETADPVSDLAIVQSRLDAHERRLADVEDRVDELGDDLQRAVTDDGSPLAVFDAARTLRRVSREANNAQQAADELQMDLEEFEQWVNSHDARVDAVDADLGAIEETVEDLQTAAMAVEDAVDDDAEPDRAVERADLAWADTVLRHAVIDLLCADLQAEVAELRTWTRREDEDEDWADTASIRLANAEEGLDAAQIRLDNVARQSWIERHGDRLSEFESVIDDAGLPVDWEGIQARLQEHRQELQRGAQQDGERGE